MPRLHGEKRARRVGLAVTAMGELLASTPHLAGVHLLVAIEIVAALARARIPSPASAHR